MKTCPICNTPLEPQLFSTVFIYYCPTCSLYYKQVYGKLYYPLQNIPKEYVEFTKVSMGSKPVAHDISMFRKFLTKVYGLPMREYKRLRDEEKRKIRELYRRWLKTQMAKAEANRAKVIEGGPESEYIPSGALQGIRRDEVPEFERFLAEAGLTLGDFYDLDPKMQKDIRWAFRRWKQGEQVIIK